MGQFSVEKPVLPGSALNGNQQSSVYRQFRRWTLSGVWDVLLAALNESGEGRDSVQTIDSTIVRAHQPAAGAQKKRALRAKVLAAREVASRPRSI